MTSLADIEAEFQAAMLSPHAGAPKGVLSGTHEPAKKMFGIYWNAYRIRLVESLGVDFPGLKALLGPTGFAAIAQEYVQRHPSKCRSIRWIGSDLCDFIAQHPRLAGDPMPVDMARADWAFAHAFDAADLEPASLSSLLAIPPEAWGSLRIDFHPSLQAFAVATPVLDARQALLVDPHAPVDRTLRRNGGVMIWRLGADLKYRDLAIDELAAYRGMEQGARFADMCELMAEFHSTDAAMRAATILRGWIDWGAIGHVSHDALASN
jgi:hypothetical protein